MECTVERIVLCVAASSCQKLAGQWGLEVPILGSYSVSPHELKTQFAIYVLYKSKSSIR